jgi:hypothetical protein
VTTANGGRPTTGSRHTYMKLKCDECGGLRVERFTKDPPKEPEPKSMSEFAASDGQPTFSYAVLRYTTWVLLCQDCGYRLEYTRPS